MVRFIGVDKFNLVLKGTRYEIIVENPIIFDKNIWDKVKRIIYREQIVGEFVFVPITAYNGKLLWYAYEDQMANRQIRQLRELSQLSNKALQFGDVYPACQMVTIYECNELAVLFAKYLIQQGIGLEVFGDGWQQFGFYDRTCQSEVSSASHMYIYSEGQKTYKDSQTQWPPKSAAYEFECIDNIYEENIRNGIIKDGIWNQNEFLEHLKNQMELVLIGTDIESLSFYNFLLSNHIKIACFMRTNENEKNQNIYGIPVYDYNKVKNCLNSPVFLECHDKASSWGFGQTDLFDYLGYQRNERFYLTRDYLEVKEKSILYILKQQLKKKRILLLVGDIWLCRFLFNILCMYSIQEEIVFFDVLGENEKRGEDSLPIEENVIINENMDVLLVIPEFTCPPGKNYISKRKQRYKDVIEKVILPNNTISNFYSYIITFLSLEKEYRHLKYQNDTWLLKGIAIGSAEACCGNMFLKGILDNHPQILMLREPHFFCENIFWIAERLSTLNGECIIENFWRICQLENQELSVDKAILNQELEKRILSGQKYSPQELFIIFHVAFVCAYGRRADDLKEFIIYWEPHFIETWIKEEFATWLGANHMKMYILNIVRDARIANGSIIKIYERLGKENYKKAIGQVRSFDFRKTEKKNYKYTTRIVVRFEDIKLAPRVELESLCAQLNISWSDTLLSVTEKGVKVGYSNGDGIIKDFDLAPVYNRYEKYFSDFDRFRVGLMYSAYQKKYGYDYMSVIAFSRKEINDYFSKRFRFEEEWKIELFDIYVDEKATDLCLQRLRYLFVVKDNKL